MCIRDRYNIMKKYGMVEKLSEKLKIKNGKVNLDENLILIDKMGELINLYKAADIVILGGSFVDNVGGHNPIEAAYFNKPIISGKYYFNQLSLYREVENIEICEVDEINEAIKKAKPTKIKNRVNLDKIVEIIGGDDE
jgi:3-deoxy-D-manno-octulosonic-acid transferase